MLAELLFVRKCLEFSFQIQQNLLYSCLGRVLHYHREGSTILRSFEIMLYYIIYSNKAQYINIKKYIDIMIADWHVLLWQSVIWTGVVSFARIEQGKDVMKKHYVLFSVK